MCMVWHWRVTSGVRFSLRREAWNAAAISLAGLALSCADWRFPKTSVVGVGKARQWLDGK
jgi:hypothetical protein